jgi:hypothetical protein
MGEKQLGRAGRRRQRLAVAACLRVLVQSPSRCKRLNPGIPERERASPVPGSLRRSPWPNRNVQVLAAASAHGAWAASCRTVPNRLFCAMRDLTGRGSDPSAALCSGYPSERVSSRPSRISAGQVLVA